MSTAIQEQGQALMQKRVDLQTFIKDNTEANGAFKTAESFAEALRRDAEINTLTDALVSAKATDAMRERNEAAIKELTAPIRDVPAPGYTGYTDQPAGTNETLGMQFTKSAAYKAHVADKQIPHGAEFKTVMTTGAGYAPANNRTNIVIPYALRRPMVMDLIPVTDVDDLTSVTFLVENAPTNNAAPVAENAIKPESALSFSPVTYAIEVIATTLPVTMQQLTSIPQLQSVIDNRLTRHLDLAVEDQLMNGNGTSPQLHGFYTDVTQAQAVGSDLIHDAFFKAMTQIAGNDQGDPSAIIINPFDWQKVRLYRAPNDGKYLWGDPSESGIARMWGLPIVSTRATSAGTGLVGDFATYAHITRRLQTRIEVGYVNDDFKYNRQTIRIETWLDLEIYRKTAFTKVTGI